MKDDLETSVSEKGGRIGIQNDIEICQIKNWRRDTIDKDHWREIINRNVQIRPVNSRIKDIIYEYKQRAMKRRGDELAAVHGRIKRKVTEVLFKDLNNQYKCPGCKKQFKPQGITNHGKSL